MDASNERTSLVVEGGQARVALPPTPGSEMTLDGCRRTLVRGIGQSSCTASVLADAVFVVYVIGLDIACS